MKTKQVFCTRHSDARVVTTTWMARTCWTSTKRMPRIKTPSTRSLGSRDELLQRKTCVRPCTQAMPFQAAGSVGNLHARSATYRTTELFPSRDFGKRVLIPRSLFHHMKALRRVCTCTNVSACTDERGQLSDPRRMVMDAGGWIQGETSSTTTREDSWRSCSEMGHSSA